MESTNFDKTPLEKQMAVINAGFTCFAKDGYQKTAMSEIAKAAGVSKAALFHYFGTKRELYFYLFRFSCGKISASIPRGSADFFECIDIGTKTKLAVMEKYPGMYDFLVSVVKSTDADMEELIREANARAISEGIKTLFANVDWSRFKPDISQKDAVAMVNWVSEGCLRENASKPRDVVLLDIERYLSLLRRALYREEYL